MAGVWENWEADAKTTSVLAGTDKIEGYVTETPRPWDRRENETTKAYAAFLAYISLGARRSVREAARQHHGEATASGEIHGIEKTTLRTWEGWSSKHAWVSRSTARDEWILSTSDEQIIINILACKLALVTRAHAFLSSTDSEVFLRGARAFTLQHPPVQQVEDLTRIEDLPDMSDADLDRMKEIRDEARTKKERRSRMKKPGQHVPEIICGQPVQDEEHQLDANRKRALLVNRAREQRAAIESIPATADIGTA